MIDVTQAQQVRATIHRAFAELPVPTREALIPQPPACDDASRAEIREALAGRSWQSLEPEFVEQRWAAFCYLSPEAYRYYLPALIVAGLTEAPEPTDLTHSILFGLLPCFVTLYYGDRDPHWRWWRDWYRARQECFTDEQHRAVCEFLGLFVRDDAHRYQHLAAQGLRWRWNRLDTPALHAAQEYYHRLHHFTYPEPTDPRVAAVCAEIRSAFAHTPYPGDEQLTELVDDEATENAMELRGLRWQSVHPKLLANCYTALTFLSDAGLRYFLPAFLMADLQYYGSNGDPLYASNAEPIYGLTRGWEADLGPHSSGVTEAELEEVLGRERLEFLKRRGVDSVASARRDDTARRFAAFTRAERLAIIHYLEYRSDTESDGHDAARILAALAGYWRPSADAAAR